MMKKLGKVPLSGVACTWRLVVGVFEKNGVRKDGGAAKSAAMMPLRMEFGMATVLPAMRMPVGCVIPACGSITTAGSVEDVGLYLQLLLYFWVPRLGY